jgi:DNA-binding transcriptional LysR family regulator
MIQNIRYRQLKAFAAVVETGSFRAGADRLAVTQPSFSSLIKELELDVGVMLFERTTRKCRPTVAGQAFYEQVKGALDNLEAAYVQLKEVGAGSRGNLSMAALPSLSSGIITTKLAEFQRSHPGVRVSLRERKHDQVLTAVRNGEVEFGIGSMLKADPDLTFEPLFTDQLMIVVPAGHPLTAMRYNWMSLEKYNLVLLTAGPAEHALKVSNVQARQVLEVEQAATALAMVRHGMGVTVLPSSIVPALNVDGLVLLPVPGKLAIRQLGLIRKAGMSLGAPARAFAESLKGVSLRPSKKV